MNLPKISVVTVTFNAVDVIEKTLLSVLGQRYENLEYLIIDGASSDGTMAVVDRYRDRIDYISSEPDRGLYDAMNKGAAAATGDYVIMMNADDVFADDRVVADVAAFLGEHPDCDVVFGDTEELWEYGPVVRRPQQAYRNHKMCISPQAAFTRTELMRLHPFNLQYRYAADFEQFSTFYLAGKVFLRIDRLIARVEKRGGVTRENHLASAREIYSIIESQGFDVRREKRRILRHIRMVDTFKRLTPGWIANPVLRLVAKCYKPL